MTTHSVRTVFLMLLVAGLFMLVGQMLGGSTGVTIAFVLAMGMNFFSYWYSDKMVLSMYKAKVVDKSNAPNLYSLVEDLANKAGVPMPKVYIIPQAQPNAFATGRNPDNAVVAVTEGLLKMLDRDQLKGVLAHEFAHILHRDILTQTVVTTIVSALSLIANFAYFIPLGNSDDDGPHPFVALLTLMLAPIAGGLIQAAISRTREYEADRVGAELSGKPLSLATALASIEQSVRMLPMQVSHTAAGATAHMFPVNPFKGTKMSQVFSTHPDTQERIHNLEEMNRTGVYPGA